MSDEHARTDKASAPKTHRVRRAFAWIGGVLAIIVVGVLIFTQTSAFRSILRDQLNEQLENTLAGHVEIGAIDGNLFTDVSVSDLRVYDSSGRLAAAAAAAKADYDLISLLDRKLSIERVTLTRPIALVYFDEQGTLNLTQITEPVTEEEEKPASEPFIIAVSSIEARDATVLYIDERELVGDQDALAKARALIADTDALLADDAVSVLSALARSAPASTPLPGIASVGSLQVEGASFLLDATDTVTAHIPALSAELDTNAWAEPVALASRELGVTFGPSVVRITHDELALAADSGWRNASIGLNLIPPPDDAPDAMLPSIELIAASIERARIAPPLLKTIVPTLETDLGATLSLTAAGDPESARIRALVDLDDERGRVAIDALLKDVLARLLEDRPLWGEGAEPLAVTARLEVDDLDLRGALKGAPDLRLSRARLGLAARGSTLRDLTASANLEASNARYDAWIVESASISAAAQDGALTLYPSTLRSPVADLSAQGALGLDGAFQLTARARSPEEKERTSALAIPSVGALSASSLALDLKTDGRLDLDAPDPAAMIERLRLDTSWRARDLDLPGASIASTRGELDLVVAPPGSGQAHRLTFDVDARIQGASIPTLASIGAASVDADGTTLVDLSSPEASAILDATRADLVASASRFRGFEASVGEARATVALRPNDGPGAAYEAEIRAEGFAYEPSDLRLGALEASARGGLALSSTNEISSLSAKGSAAIEALKAGETRVEGATATFDVAGIPPDLRGSLDLDARGVEAAGESISRASIRASIDEERRFVADATALRTGQGSVPLRFKASGQLGAELESVRDLDASLYADAEASGEPILRVEQSGVSWRDGDLSFDKLTVSSSDGGRIQVDGSFRARGAQDLELVASRIDLGALRERLGLGGLLPPISGSIDALELTLGGSARDPEVELSLDAKRLRYEGLGPFSIVVRGSYEEARLTVNTLTLEGWDTELVRAQARVPIRLDFSGRSDVIWTEPLTANLWINRIDLALLAPRIEQLAGYKILGVIEGGGIVSGTLRRPTLDLSLQGSGVAFKGRVGNTEIEFDELGFEGRAEYEPPSGEEGGFAGSTRLHRGGRTIASLEGAAPLPISEWIYEMIELDRAPDLTRELFETPLRVEGSVAETELSEWSAIGLTPDLELGGTASGKLVIEGAIGEPRIEAGARVDELAMRGVLGGQKLDLEKIDAGFEFAFKPITSSGAAPNEGVHWDARVAIADEPVASIDLDAALPIAAWVRRTLLGEAPDYASEALDRRVDLAVRVERLDLRELNVDPLLRAEDAAGVISASLDLHGTARAPEIDLSLGVGDKECAPQSPGAAPVPCGGLGWGAYRDVITKVEASYRDEELRVATLDVNWDSLDVARGGGTFPLPLPALIAGEELPAGQPIDFDLEILPIPLTKLSGIDYDFASLSGALNAYVRLDGTLRAPDLSARAAMVDLRTGGGDLATIAVELDAKDDVVRADILACRAGRDALVGRGAARANLNLVSLLEGADPLAARGLEEPRGGLESGQELALDLETPGGTPVELRGLIPNALIDEFVEDLRGALSLDLSVDGTWEAPKPRGYVKLDRGALTLTQYGRRFNRVDLNASIDEDQIEIKNLSVEEGETSIKASAEIAHERLSPRGVDARARFDEFNFGGFVEFPFFATGRVAAQGDLAASPMKVEVNISGLDVQLAEEIKANLHETELSSEIVLIPQEGLGEDDSQEVSGIAAELIGAEGTPGAGAVAADIHVKLARDTWVRHPYGEINLVGDFIAHTQGAEVSMEGNIEAIRGQVEFFGKAFRVERALVTFTGATPPDPRLQIEASYELARSVTESIGPSEDGQPNITIAVSGQATAPELKLTSDPPMSESDILYVLATNRAPNTADVGQDSAVASAALSAASGVVAELVKQELAEVLPLDFFDVLRADTSNFEVGKYFLRGKLYVGYRYLFGGSNEDGESLYEVDYFFLPRWSFELLRRNSVQRDQIDANIFWDIY